MEDYADIGPIEGNVKGSNGLDHNFSSTDGQTVGGATPIGRRRERKVVSTADTVQRIAQRAGAELAGDKGPGDTTDAQALIAAKGSYPEAAAERDRIRDALDAVWAGGDGQSLVADELVKFFGADTDGEGWRLFEAWVSKCQTPDRDIRPPRRTPLEEWKGALEKRRDECSLSELLLGVQGMGRVVGSPIRVWPEPKSQLEPHKPIGKSKPNISVALKHLGATVYKDEFSLRYRIEGFRHFSDLDDEALRALWFACRSLGIDAAKEFFVEAALDIANGDRRHPVRDYFATLIWDGKSRIDRLLIDYAGATDTSYHRAVGRKLMIAIVRRVMQPGTKFDTVPVLIGPQGAGKSTFLKTLAVDPAWFEDNLSLGADSKVVIEQTAGKLIIEISEMRGSGREVEAQKAMITRTHDTARGAYKRTAETVPRQFVLVGTTNACEFLIDHTGNRRFLPVEVGKIDIAGLKKDLGHLWAEAVAAEAKGESLQLPNNALDDARQAQRDREMTDPIFDAIAAELYDYGGVVDMETLYGIIGLDREKRDRRDQRHQQAIGRAMTRLGWSKDRVRIKGSRQYVYRKVGEQNYRFGLGRDGSVEIKELTSVVGGAAEPGSNVVRVAAGTASRRLAAPEAIRPDAAAKT